MLTPFQRFIQDQVTASVLLLIATIAALLIANSQLAHSYELLVSLPVGIQFGDWSFKMSIHHWVNDGLMAIFFFVLGLEIKREILVGELKDPQKSLPVVFAAVGGMLVPAAIYYAANAGTPAADGWGIPMATDTAFAIGILTLLGRSIPASLFAFLTALAIIDDLGAIMVIALFYTETIDTNLLLLALLFLGLLSLGNLLGMRHPLIYLSGGVLVWICMYGSGIHATVAGVLVAMTIPARPKREAQWFVNKTRKLINQFEQEDKASDKPILGEENQHQMAKKVQENAEKATTPLRRWERALEHPVALFVIPIFALANAGIPIDAASFEHIWTDRLVIGIVLGLVLGKSIGISLFVWISIRLGLGRLPEQVSLSHILGIGLLGGMGFTMSIFISGLGFADDQAALVTAKMAILIASLLAGVSGYLWLRLGALD